MGCQSDMSVTSQQGPGKYWSQKTLQEDKKRCLIGLNHPDHLKANTLENVHEGRPQASAKVLAERRKAHQPCNREWTHDRIPETKHPYAAAEGSLTQRHWSHRELQEAKMKLQTGLCKDVRPQSARSSRRPSDAGSIGPQSARLSRAGSDAGSFSSRRAEQVISCRRGSKKRGDSPTISQLLGPGDDAMSQVSWRDAVRQPRDVQMPHNSYELFEAKKRRNMTNIHEAPGDVMGSSEVDPASVAFQGEYPSNAGSEASPYAPELRWSTPRYTSHKHLTLDKGRHATQMGMTKRQMAARFSGGESEADGDIGGHSYEAPIPVNGSCTSKSYKSSLELRKHKKRHLVEMNIRGTPTVSRSNSFSGVAGHSSHRELEQAKKLNIVDLNAARAQAQAANNSFNVDPNLRRLRRSYSDVSETPSQLGSPGPSYAESQNDWRRGQYLTTSEQGFSPGCRRAALDSIASSSDVGRSGSHTKLQRDLRHHRVEREKSYTLARPTPGEQLQVPESCLSEYFMEQGSRSSSPYGPAPRNGQWTPAHL
mmetsp:Transcript_2644/g.4295  ORF Transcript_2644/g.4295 Transcript_2644/m.4295 type:complete len:537 (+) Transcript_2644:83-1693(+)